MKLDKRSKIFLIIFFSIILIPVIIIGSINYAKEQKLKNRIEITLDELFELELSKEYTTENDISTRNEKKTTITYTNTTFFGADCKKEYVFFDNKLSICIFDVDTSHWMPKDIYEELVKLNGEPDETDVKPDDK